MMKNQKVKQHNIQMIREIVYRGESFTKNSLVEETGLSLATCRNIIVELASKGEIEALSNLASTGGRPSKSFAINDLHGLILIAYLRIENGTSRLTYRLVTYANKEVDSKVYFLETVTMDAVNIHLKDVYDRYPQCSILVFGFPGVTVKGRVIICDIEALKGLSLEDVLLLPKDGTLVVENDVNATALAFAKKEEGQASLCYLYYPVSGVPGMGIVIDGKLHKGINQFAGEVSFMQGEQQEGIDYRNHHALLKDVVSKSYGVVAFINPKILVIAGYGLPTNIASFITEQLDNALPKEVQPKVISVDDIHDDYVLGLYYLGLAKRMELTV